MQRLGFIQPLFSFKLMRIKGLSIAVLLLCCSLVSQGQEMPENNPRITPFPSAQFGISVHRIVPGNQMILSNSDGWSVADTLWLVGGGLDLRLLHVEWLDLVWQHPQFSGGSDLGWRIWQSLGGPLVPSPYPRVIVKDGGQFSSLRLQPTIREFYLSNRLRYDYGRKGSVYADLDIGLSRMSLYASTGPALLGGSTVSALLGAGWLYTLGGDEGERLRLSIGLDFLLRSYDIDSPEDGLSLQDGSTTGLTPIQSLKLSGPMLHVGIEAGEFMRSRYIPYRDPYNLQLATFSAGLGLPTYISGETVLYDSLNNDLSVSFFPGLMRQYEVHLFRYNWLYHLLPQADIDLLSGVSLRFSRALQRTSLPASWPNSLVRGEATISGLQLRPDLREWSLDHELIYPLARSLFGSVYAGMGFANLTLYENAALQRVIESSATTWNLGLGAGFTVQGDAGSKVAIGASLKYFHQAFDIDLAGQDLELPGGASGEITPIRSIDLSQPLVSLQVGLIFGGSSNKAYEAHKKFQEGNFLEALAMQEEFTKVSPWHHNHDQIKVQIEEMKDSVAADYYREVDRLVSKGQLEQAFSLIRLENDPRLRWVEAGINDLRGDIAVQALRKAAWSIGRYDYATAENWILLAIKSDPSVHDVAVILLSRCFLIRATILYQFGVYERSLVWLDRADALSRRYDYAIQQLRRKIGDGRLDDANEGIVREDRIVVHDAMQEAKDLNPLLAEIVDRYMEGLEAAIDYYDDKTVGTLKHLAMDQILDDVSGLDPKDFKPAVGMKAVLVQRYVGEPKRRFNRDEFELWVYQLEDQPETWLYIREGLIEKIERK